MATIRVKTRAQLEVNLSDVPSVGLADIAALVNTKSATKALTPFLEIERGWATLTMI